VQVRKAFGEASIGRLGLFVLWRYQMSKEENMKLLYRALKLREKMLFVLAKYKSPAALMNSMKELARSCSTYSN
jgi:hypothetical protein